MRIIMKERSVSEVDTDTMLEMKFGKGAAQIIAKDCRRARKNCQETQRSMLARKRHPIGTLVMQIPAVLVMQDTLKGPEFWYSEEGRKRLATFWEEFPDMRRVETKGNPFGKTGFFTRSKK